MVAFLLRTLENIYSVHNTQNVFDEKGSNPHQSSSVSWEGPYETMQRLPRAKSRKPK